MKQFESFDTNLRDEAQDLLLLQYQNDPQFTQWIDELIKPLENLKRILLDFNRIFDIDKAEGFWLDKIGKLFCVPRRFCVMRLTQSATPHFAFNDSSFLPTKYGYWNDGSVAGYWSDYSLMVLSDTFVQSCSMLDDIDYRKLIKARIAKNHSKATAEDIILAVSNILGHNKFYLAEQPEGEPMTLGLVLGASISQFDMDLFLYSDVAPKPSGVRYATLKSLPNGKVFAFDDTTWTVFPHGYFNDDANFGYWIN